MIYMQGLSVEQLTDIIDQVVSKRLAEAMVNKQQDKWLSVNEARKMWQPAISRNTLEKWSLLHEFTVQRFGGQKKYLLSDIINQVKQVKKFK